MKSFLPYAFKRLEHKIVKGIPSFPTYLFVTVDVIVFHEIWLKLLLVMRGKNIIFKRNFLISLLISCYSYGKACEYYKLRRQKRPPAKFADFFIMQDYQKFFYFFFNLCIQLIDDLLNVFITVNPH